MNNINPYIQKIMQAALGGLPALVSRVSKENNISNVEAISYIQNRVKEILVSILSSQSQNDDCSRQVEAANAELAFVKQIFTEYKQSCQGKSDQLESLKTQYDRVNAQLGETSNKVIILKEQLRQSTLKEGTNTNNENDLRTQLNDLLKEKDILQSELRDHADTIAKHEYTLTQNDDSNESLLRQIMEINQIKDDSLKKAKALAEENEQLQSQMREENLTFSRGMDEIFQKSEEIRKKAELIEEDSQQLRKQIQNEISGRDKLTEELKESTEETDDFRKYSDDLEVINGKLRAQIQDLINNHVETFATYSNDANNGKDLHIKNLLRIIEQIGLDEEKAQKTIRQYIENYAFNLEMKRKLEVVENAQTINIEARVREINILINNKRISENSINTEAYDKVTEIYSRLVGLDRDYKAALFDKNAYIEKSALYRYGLDTKLREARDKKLEKNFQLIHFDERDTSGINAINEDVSLITAEIEKCESAKTEFLKGYADILARHDSVIQQCYVKTNSALKEFGNIVSNDAEVQTLLDQLSLLIEKRNKTREILTKLTIFIGKLRGADTNKTDLDSKILKDLMAAITPTSIPRRPPKRDNTHIIWSRKSRAGISSPRDTNDDLDRDRSRSPVRKKKNDAEINSDGEDYCDV